MQPQLRSFILSEKDRIFYVILNRPHRANSLDPDTVAELSKAMQYYDQNKDLWVAIISANGPLFSAGFDLKWYSDNLSSDIFSRNDKVDFIPKISKPIIAAVNGGAHGGGFELVLCCDIVIACPEAKFQLPEPKVGLAAIRGGLVRLPRFVGYQRAMEIILTSRVVPVEEARSIGLVAEIVDKNKLIHRATEIAKLIMSGSPDAIILSKKIAQLAMEESSMETVLRKQGELPEYKKMLDGQNKKEGVTAFLQKRKPVWQSHL